MNEMVKTTIDYFIKIFNNIVVVVVNVDAVVLVNNVRLEFAI